VRHYCELISNPKQMGRVLHLAMQSAVGKRGAGVVVLPGDVCVMEMPSNGIPHSVITQRTAVRPCETDIARLAEVLNSARRVALFCGFGCADAHDEVVALAEKLKAPIGVAYRGKPYVAYDNPFEVGMIGLMGYGPALIDVVTDPNALSMPSHITADQVKGFGLTMMKLILSGHVDEVVETVEGNIRHI
jgi:pyruvate dehydrogenase (quinone)